MVSGSDGSAWKRKAEEEEEEELDDPRFGVWANTGQEDDAPVPGGAEASGSGLKRPADEPADDRDRGDESRGSGDDYSSAAITAGGL